MSQVVITSIIARWLRSNGGGMDVDKHRPDSCMIAESVWADPQKIEIEIGPGPSGRVKLKEEKAEIGREMHPPVHGLARTYEMTSM